MNAEGFIMNRIAMNRSQGREYTIKTRKIRDLLDGKIAIGPYSGKLVLLFESANLDTIKRVVFVGEDPGYSGTMQTSYSSVPELEDNLKKLGDLSDVAVVHVDSGDNLGHDIIVNRDFRDIHGNHDLCEIIRESGLDCGKDVKYADNKEYLSPAAHEIYRVSDRMGAKAVSLRRTKGEDISELIGYMMTKL